MMCLYSFGVYIIYVLRKVGCPDVCSKLVNEFELIKKDNIIAQDEMSFNLLD